MPEGRRDEALRRPDAINVAMVVPMTEAEGPGRRFALWVQGCPMRCPECCNPEMLPFREASWRSVVEMIEEVRSAQRAHGVEGITLLGGEPFAQAEALAVLCEGVRGLGLSVMVFSGYTLAELRGADEAGVAALLEQVDLLVDGRYVKTKPDGRRRWIGSTNQIPHAFGPRYRQLVESWDESPDTVEIRIVGGKLVANGSPVLLEKLRGS